VFEPDAPEAETAEEEIVIEEVVAEVGSPAGPVEVVEETVIDVVAEPAPEVATGEEH
jgi:hypothetical protein